jgi:hypothetical protein
LLFDRKRGWWLDGCAIFALAAILIFPLLRVKYLDNWPSIEATFIADAHLLQENPGHHLWQPLWYLGTRTDYVYPPGLRYGVAGLSFALRSTPAKAYHIFIALFYALGIVGVYLWARTGSGSRGVGWLTAVGVALISPVLWMLPEWRADSPFFVPFRLHALMTYGEGPHISSLAVLPLVWLGAWRRFRGGSVGWLFLSAVAAALVVTLNFYGAVALGMTFALVGWACFLEAYDWLVLRDSLLIAALAYGLTAWWLTPSYIRLTIGDLHLVAPGSTRGSGWVLAVMVVAYVGVSLGLRRRCALEAYSFFNWSMLLVLSVYIFGQRWFGSHVEGEALRLLPEWDLAVVLCAVILGTWTWRRWPDPMPRAAVAALALACMAPSGFYLTHAYSEFRSDREWEQRLEYRTPAWLARKFPGQRVFVTGTMRFWYNAWGDGLQADGGSDQGVLHPLFESLRWRLLYDGRPEVVRHWLQALGIDIVVVPGPSSREPYKDFTNASLYEGNFPLLFDDGAGNRFYRVPRRTPGIVRMVDRSKVLGAEPIPKDYETVQLAAYVDAIENGEAGNGTIARWRGSDELDVEADARPGEALLVEETYDPYWRAYADGQRQTVRRDAAGLMLIDVPPGRHLVRLVFETPVEDSVGRMVTLATLLVMIGAAIRYSRLREALE